MRCSNGFHQNRTGPVGFWAAVYESTPKDMQRHAKSKSKLLYIIVINAYA